MVRGKTRIHTIAGDGEGKTGVFREVDSIFVFLQDFPNRQSTLFGYPFHVGNRQGFVFIRLFEDNLPVVTLTV